MHVDCTRDHSRNNTKIVLMDMWYRSFIYACWLHVFPVDKKHLKNNTKVVLMDRRYDFSSYMLTTYMTTFVDVSDYSHYELFVKTTQETIQEWSL